MQLTQRERKIKYLIYCIVILAAALVQNVSGLWFEINSARCFFILPVVVTLGIDEDERISALLGLFAGLLWDMLSAQHMGFNIVFIMLACYVTSALVSYIFRSTYWVNVICSVAVTLLYCFVYWLLFVLLKGSDGSAIIFLQFYLPCFIYTSIMGLGICALLLPLKHRLNKEISLD